MPETDRLPLSDIGNKMKQTVPTFLPTDPQQTSWANTQQQNVCSIHITFIHK